MQADELLLRDVHVPDAPSLWPLAPGWWLVLAVLGVVIAVVVGLRLYRRHRLARWRALFDGSATTSEPATRVAAISELLRRAARRVEPQADRLQGEAWLGFLDGETRKDFTAGAGRILLDGGYRRNVDAEALGRLETVACERFLELMAGRR